MTVKREKVVAMLSGGLDSTLAAKMMVDQGLEVVAFNMVSPFCTCTPKKSGCHNLAVEMGRQIGIEVVLKAKGEDYVEVIRNPKFGYGSGLNPCIDCRIYTFVKAKEFMAEIGAIAQAFIASNGTLDPRTGFVTGWSYWKSAKYDTYAKGAYDKAAEASWPAAIKELKGLPVRFVGAAANPFADPFEIRAARLGKKAKAELLKLHTASQ